MRRTHRLLLAVLFTIVAGPAGAQFSTSVLRPTGYHPSNIAYFNVPYFADAFAQGEGWLSFTGFDFGAPIDTHTSQFDANGYPKFLDPGIPGQRLRAILFGLNINNPFRPPGWPPRETLARGQIIATWKGDADVRVIGCNFVGGGLSGPATGSLVDGRRIYLCSSSQSTQSLEIHAINTPITEIHVWLPPPDDPLTPAHENETGTLEGQLFHPLLLQRLTDADWGFIRFMDWGATNSSPQQDWADRRLPSHGFLTSVLNQRGPVPGNLAFSGNRLTGVAFEHMVMLCNQRGRNLWINVPHLASDDFITKLAQLIRFGSDGHDPYTSLQANPVFEPLHSDLRVYVEFSNEIWSSGDSFAQGEWAQGQATAIGITKAQFNARRFCDTWRLFQQVFGSADRLVRVAAIFTGLESYSRDFLEEIGDYGTTLVPSVRPDVMAVTTYFGNGIQDFVNTQGYGAGLLFNNPYWVSPQFVTDRQTAFAEWTRRILAGDSAQGGGFDTTSVGGGFAASLRTLPNETLGYSLPIVAYEGGPSLYTDYIDGGAANGSGVPTDDRVTTFIEAMNRDPLIASVYDIHLNLAKSKALWTHTPYTDSGLWSKFGQWGHLETFDQRPVDSPKYALMLSHGTEFTAVRHIDTPIAAVPQFSTVPSLPVAIVGQFYTNDVFTSGGNGARTVKIIGAFLDSGLTAALVGGSPDQFRISGTPLRSQRNFVFGRVVDADGDPSWRIFTLETFGGPGTLVQSDFRGTSPSSLPSWTPTYVLSPKVTWSGWSRGAGAVTEPGDDAYVFSVAGGGASGDDTFADAIADQFLRATVTPATPPLDLRGAEIRFITRRIGFHSPRGYAFTSSVGGFTTAGAHYVSPIVDKGDTSEIEHVFRLPSTAAFSALSGPVEFRIYAFSAQFNGHRTSVSGFKLTELTPLGPRGDADGNGTVTIADVFVLINHLFGGGPTPNALADVNGDGLVTVADVNYLVDFLYAAGPAPI